MRNTTVQIASLHKLFTTNQPHYKESNFGRVEVKYWCEKGRSDGNRRQVRAGNISTQEITGSINALIEADSAIIVRVTMNSPNT